MNKLVKQSKIDWIDDRFIDPFYMKRFSDGSLVDEPSRSPEHRGVVVATSGQVAIIDTALAELFYYLWRNGIQTSESCQDAFGGESPSPWSASDGLTKAPWLIGFLHPTDAELFLSLAVREGDAPGSMWERATGGIDPPVGWYWQIIPNISDEREVFWQLSVIIPFSDIAPLTRMFKDSAVPAKSEAGTTNRP